MMLFSWPGAAAYSRSMARWRFCKSKASNGAGLRLIVMIIIINFLIMIIMFNIPILSIIFKFASLRPPMALIFTLLKLKISGHDLVMFNFLIAIMMFNFLILIIILKFASLGPQMALTSVWSSLTFSSWSLSSIFSPWSSCLTHHAKLSWCHDHPALFSHHYDHPQVSYHNHLVTFLTFTFPHPEHHVQTPISSILHKKARS